MVVTADWSIWDPRIVVICSADNMHAVSRADGLLWMRLAAKSVIDGRVLYWEDVVQIVR